MPIPLIRILAYLLGSLPLSVNHSIGSLIGILAWHLNSRARTITEINLQLCFPETALSERQHLARRSLIETGKQLTECAWIWHQPTRKIAARIQDTPGRTLLEEAIGSQRGVIIVSPHIGNWELCCLPASQHAPFTYLYRKPRNPDMDPLLIKWRANLGGQPASLDAGGIRTALRILKKGGVLGILPDQEPDWQNGLFAPFFEQPALTMTLLSKLARRSGAQVLLCISERLPAAQGWRVHFLNADPLISHSDPAIAAAAVNHDVQRCISVCREQYLWNYKRFNTLPDGSARNYRQSPEASKKP